MAMRESASIRGRVRPSKRARDPRRRRRVRARLLRQPRRRLSRRLRAPGAWPAALAPPRGFRTRRHPRPVSRRAPLRPRVRARVDGGDPRGGAQRVGRVPRRETPVSSQTPILEVAGGGWRRATLVCDDTRDAETLRSLCPEQSVAVLCERRVDETDPWPRSVDGEELPVARRRFRRARHAPRGLRPIQVLRLGRRARAHGPLLRGMETLARDASSSRARGVRGVRGGSTTDSRRGRSRIGGRHGARDGRGRDDGGVAQGGGASVVARARGKTLVGVAGVRGVAQHQEITRADARGDVGAAARGCRGRSVANLLPAEELAAHPAFVRFLDANFNEPQLAAIRWSAAHTLRSYERDRAAAANEATADEASAPSSAPSSAPFPFTLVQGPPGTGKTHTVWGILNILHLVLYQRHYQHLHRAIALGAARARAAATRRSPPPPPPPDGSRDSIAKTNPTPTRNPPR